MIDSEPTSITGAELAYGILRSRIMSGELTPETNLRERAIADELGLSRTPVREALRRLSESGLVRVSPNRGATVVGWSAEQMEETYFLRAALESRGAGLAAELIDEATLSELGQLIEEMEAFVDSENVEEISRLGELNRQFHQAIIAASGSRQLITLVEAVSQAPMMVRDNRAYGVEFRSRSNHQHRDILTALRSRDAMWAEVVMRSHILAARNAVRQGPRVHHH